MEPNSKHVPQLSGGSKSGSDTAGLATMWSRARVKHILNSKGYIIGRCIGSGSYSKVYQTFYRPPRLESGPGHSIACKLIDRRRTSKEYERLMPRETVAMLALSHPHIVSVMSIQEYGPFVCVFMDYCRYGDLLQYIQMRKRISERRSRMFFRQLVEAVHYMHEQGFCHRDIKCENVLLASPSYLKLTDFSFAKKCSDPKGAVSQLSETYCGSIAYTAPEVLKGIPYDPKAHDMWSLGCVLFIMVSGTMPFDESNIAVTIGHQERKQYGYPSDMTLNPTIMDLIDRLIEPDVSLRATVSQVANDPWVLG
ncbi:testis-specific serine/threonine-protein kinase 3-like [Anopheles maculipalpis]|uniref:testis-specific serine/threonine-protein kinase 3-like n=1 Tax=Anopheles maculipalpis TaxID=1496333 RepID=UPI002158B804|nr:testis-specific serine/threonine-protein kinase 3-like [Anopheles maculipalpis]